MLRCVAVCCSGLQWVAVCCSGLQWVAVCYVVSGIVERYVCCSGLQWVAVGCSGLQWVASWIEMSVVVCISVWHCVAVCCSVLHRGQIRASLSSFSRPFFPFLFDPTHFLFSPLIEYLFQVLALIYSNICRDSAYISIYSYIGSHVFIYTYCLARKDSSDPFKQFGYFHTDISVCTCMYTQIYVLNNDIARAYQHDSSYE